MEVKMISVNDIKPYENNPRKNDDAVDEVALSRPLASRINHR